jgi:hypothetical protein
LRWVLREQSRPELRRVLCFLHSYFNILLD